MPDYSIAEEGEEVRMSERVDTVEICLDFAELALACGQRA